MIFKIAAKDLKVIYRDKRSLVMLILMPVVLIFVLGTVLQGMFAQEFKIKKFTVGIVNEDEGYMSQIFINDILRNNMSEMVNVFVLSSKNEASRLIEAKKIPVAIFIPKDYSKSFEEGKESSMQISGQPDAMFQTGIINEVALTYAKYISLYQKAADGIIEVMKDNKLSFNNIPNNSASNTTNNMVSSTADNAGLTDYQSGLSPYMNVVMDIQKYIKQKNIEFVENTEKEKNGVSAMQYYACTMMIMYVLFGVNFGARHLLEERKTNTLSRMLIGNISKTAVICGKVAGLFVIGIAQVIILMLVSSVFFKVNWGNSIISVLAVSVCLSFASSGLCVLIASFAKDISFVDSVGSLVIQVSTLVSGGMIPIYNLPDIMHKIAYGTVNWWAMQGYLHIMMGSGIESILIECAMMFGMGMLFMMFGIKRLKI